MSKNEMTPQDKLLKAIFGKKYKTEAEVEAEIDSIPEADVKVNHDTMLLFIRAMKRLDELKPMVEMLSKDKYFPNEHYRETFEWSLMQAAQWQYDKLMAEKK